MIIALNTKSDTPIYLQLRNRIVCGIGKGELKPGEKLPTVRRLAADAGINTMTVNKAYQLLKSEGYIETDRRNGAIVAAIGTMSTDFEQKLEKDLELLSAEACLKGMNRHDFLTLCDRIFSGMTPATANA